MVKGRKRKHWGCAVCGTADEAEEVLWQEYCSGYWGWQAGVVCWVIKLLGCEAAGSLLLCCAPGLKCAAQLCATDDCCANGVQEHKKGVLSQLDSVANGGERRVYWLLPGISPAGILQRILPNRLLPGILRGEYIAASSQRQCSLQEQLVAAAIKGAAFHLQ